MAPHFYRGIVAFLVILVLLHVLLSDSHLKRLPSYPKSSRFNQTMWAERIFRNLGQLQQENANSSNLTNLTSLRSQYHKYWEVNCSAIFSGDKAEIDKTLKTLRQEKINGSFPVPSDVEVSAWTRDCKAYRTIRNYPLRPASAEEADFPLAYIIVTHVGSAQVERLLRTIYQPQNIYCIHPDRKSPEEFHGAIRGLAECFDNVFIASKLEEVKYAGFTRLLADINCMRDLTGPRTSTYRWKYLLNLCGQDFPLKTNLEIVRALGALKGQNNILSIHPPRYKVKWTSFAVVNGTRSKNYPKPPPPHSLQIFAGSAYLAATRSFIEAALTDQRAIDLLTYLSDTYSPDESYWATLNQASWMPGSRNSEWTTDNATVRFIRWTRNPKTPRCDHGLYVRLICIFGVRYMRHFVGLPHLFANKFYYSYDPIALQCLEESLDQRNNNSGSQGLWKQAPHQ